MTRETVGQEGSRLMVKKDNLQNACEGNSMQSRQDISFGIYIRISAFLSTVSPEVHVLEI
jgi:hypothetical protein